jgi:hypothetical protein
MPTIQEIDQWAGIVFQIAGALAAFAVFVGAFTVVFEYRRGVRDGIRLKQEQWRISYRNLNLTHSSILTNRASAPVVRSNPSVTPFGRKISPDISPSERKTSVASQTEDSQFLIFQLELENIGDGPVDVWACFVAARELNAGDHREAWGGNIEWNDLDPYYFDTETPEWEHLAGISNTRHVVYSQDDYIELDPKEHDTVTRIDRIDPIQRHLTLLYRAFLVGHGYGGDYSKRAPQRDLLARQRLQQALFNVSGPSFRILFNERDPLDLVANRDGFPCFMLYHLAFTDDHRDQTGWTNIDWVNASLEGEWGRNHDYPDALALVEDKLGTYKGQWRRHWSAFNQAVAQAKALPGGFADLIKSDWRPQVPGEPAGAFDLTTLTAKQAFARLPRYLRWDLDDEDSLPFWEKFFVVPLPPGEELREPRTLELQS